MSHLKHVSGIVKAFSTSEIRHCRMYTKNALAVMKLILDVRRKVFNNCVCSCIYCLGQIETKANRALFSLWTANHVSLDSKGGNMSKMTLLTNLI